MKTNNEKLNMLWLLIFFQYAITLLCIGGIVLTIIFCVTQSRCYFNIAFPALISCAFIMSSNAYLIKNNLDNTKGTFFYALAIFMFFLWFNIQGFYFIFNYFSRWGLSSYKIPAGIFVIVMPLYYTIMIVRNAPQIKKPVKLFTLIVNIASSIALVLMLKEVIKIQHAWKSAIIVCIALVQGLILFFCVWVFLKKK